MKILKSGRLTLLGMILALVFIYWQLDISHYLQLESLKENQMTLDNYFGEHPFRFSLFYFTLYVLMTALSLPGATLLTLAGGAVFGLGLGTVLVSFASSVGATLAFLASRFLFKDAVQSKFAGHLHLLNESIKKEGPFYLFTLRLIPVVPFFFVNLLMGVTPIKTSTFYLVSQAGMLIGTAIYVNAGTQIAQVESLRGLLSPGLLISMILLGAFPFFAKWLVNTMKTNKHLRQFKKPNKFDYNIVVIGGGSAGLVSSYIASAVKAKVALIEKHKMGGDCLNTGCVPSKALIKSAKVVHTIKKSQEFGMDGSTTSPNFSKIMERVQNVIQKIEPHDSVERYTSLGVECIQGQATIKTPYEVEVNGKTLFTKNIVIATGASPLVPKIPGLENVKYLTSDNLWDLRELPKELIVLGGGPIGCELAQSFARIGSKVTLVEMAPRIMNREDADVSEFIQETFKNDGVTALTSHKALRIEIKNGINTLVCENQGAEITVSFDKILLALGRKANTAGFGLENLKVEVAKNGTIAADAYLRTTNYPNIYVCGDVAGPFQFTHTASHQAWYVAVNALFSPFKKFKADYRVIPWCTFTDPEVARVGINEQEAREKHISIEVTKYELSDLDRAIAENADHGFVKVLTSPGSDKILGVTIVGEHAGELIAEYVSAMKHGLGLNKILGTIHIYPTFSEANKYAAGVWKKKNAPQTILKFLEGFHQWRRG